MFTVKNIRRENHITYTNIPSELEERMCKILDREGVEYTILGQFEIPADQPQYCVVDGEREFDVVCIVSYLNKDELFEIAEEIPLTSDSES